MGLGSSISPIARTFPKCHTLAMGDEMLRGDAGKWNGAKRLAESLRRSGFSKVEAGRRLGMSHATICRYTSGERAPSPDMLVRLCRLLGVTADYLVGLAKEPAASSEVVAAPRPPDSRPAEVAVWSCENVEELFVTLRSAQACIEAMEARLRSIEGILANGGQHAVVQRHDTADEKKRTR